MFETIIVTVIIFWAFILYLAYAYIEAKIELIKEEIELKKNSHTTENKNIIEEKISFWIVTKYTDDDLHTLKSNKDALISIMKILTYITMVRTDSLRNPDNNENLQRISWEVNAFQEILVFFHKLYQETEMRKK